MLPPVADRELCFYFPSSSGLLQPLSLLPCLRRKWYTSSPPCWVIQLKGRARHLLGATTVAGLSSVNKLVLFFGPKTEDRSHLINLPKTQFCTVELAAQKLSLFFHSNQNKSCSLTFVALHVLAWAVDAWPHLPVSPFFRPAAQFPVYSVGPHLPSSVGRRLIPQGVPLYFPIFTPVCGIIGPSSMLHAVLI